MLDIKSLEEQMDAFYSLLNPIHMQIETAIYKPGQLYVPELKNVSMNISAMLDGFRHCSEVFNELRKEEQKLTGMFIDIAKEMDTPTIEPYRWLVRKEVTAIAKDGPTGESFNPLQD